MCIVVVVVVVVLFFPILIVLLRQWKFLLWKVGFEPTEEWNDLKGKVVYITGASSGIGEALVRHLHRRGCLLIIASRNGEKLERIKRELDVVYEQIRVQTLDLSEDESSLSQKMSEAWTFFDRGIDFLINNGGVSVRGSVSETRIEVHKRIMNVNYFGPITLIRAFMIEAQRKRVRGHVINISSLQGLIAIPSRSAYSASKHALQAFSDSLRAEMSNDEVIVTVVSPGYVKTNLSQNALRGDGSAYGEMDKTTSGGYDVNYVAARILVAMVLKQNEVIIAPYHHVLLTLIRRLIPTLFFKIMKMKGAKHTSIKEK